MNRRILNLILIFIVVFAPMAVLAQDIPADPVPAPSGNVVLNNPLPVNSIEELVNRIVKWIFSVSLIVAPLMIVVGAFIFLTSAGDPTRTKTGTELIKWTIIGFVVILLSRVLVGLIRGVLGA